MDIKFYKTHTGRDPVLKNLKKLPKKTKAKISASLTEIEREGLNATSIDFRQIKNKLWEIKIRIEGVGFRIFYVMINNNIMVLLHMYKKETQKAPKKEIGIAELRMKEVLNNETNYI